MTQYTPLKLLIENIDKTVNVLGQVRKFRSGKKYSFIELGYGEHDVQVVIPTNPLNHITIQSYVEITGLVKQLPEQVYSAMPVEIAATSIKIISTSDSNYQEQCPETSSNELKLEKRHLYLRDPKFALHLQAHAHLLNAIRAHFSETDCIEITPPPFTSTECEGGATLFKLEHPGKSSKEPMTAFLTQSSQFALEMALPGLGDCFCIADSFRAENSHTRRHLTTFVHAESEWGNIMTFDDHLNKLRELMQGIVKHFLLFGEKTLKRLNVYDRVVELKKMTHDIIILEHKDAIEECRKRNIYKNEETKEHFDERDDIPEAQERQLIDQIGKIVFLTKFPKEFKSFYMGLDPEDLSRVLGCDVEVPGVGELIGSGIREGNYEQLKNRLVESGLVPDDYSEYLDLRKYGFCQTSGMGLGVGRMLTWLLGTYSIRDVTAFPRFPGNLRP